MEVILLERVAHLGKLGEKVKVKAGFGRNFLIPHGKAVSATEDNLKKFEARRAELEKAAHELLSAANKRAEKLNGLKITITAQASDEGKLYGSVGTKEIADAVTAAGAQIAKSEVLLPDGVLRSIGEFDINLQLHTDVTATVHIIIVNI